MTLRKIHCGLHINIIFVSPKGYSHIRGYGLHIRQCGLQSAFSCERAMAGERDRGGWAVRIDRVRERAGGREEVAAAAPLSPSERFNQSEGHSYSSPFHSVAAADARLAGACFRFLVNAVVSEMQINCLPRVCSAVDRRALRRSNFTGKPHGIIVSDSSSRVYKQIHGWMGYSCVLRSFTIQFRDILWLLFFSIYPSCI